MDTRAGVGSVSFFFLGAFLYVGLFLVLLVCSPVACLRAVPPPVFLFARAMACPRAFFLACVGLPAYWDMTLGAASSGNWRSRPAKHAVEEDAEIESAPSY